MSILNFEALLDQVHQYFVVDGNPPSIDENNLALSAFHGVFNGRSSRCAIAINDSDWLLGESFCVSTPSHRETALLKRVLNYPMGEPFADYELHFLDDLQVIHDDALLATQKRYDMDFRLPFKSDEVLSEVMTVFRNHVKTNVAATRSRYWLD